MTRIVINWHLTEVCNYSCQFCFAHWQRAAASEVWRDARSMRDMIAQLAQFARPDNPRWRGQVTGRPRLSLVGGEPTLWPWLLAGVVETAHQAGFEIGLISNASRPEVLVNLAPKVSVLCISVGSASPQTNRVIGRQDRHGAQIGPDALVRLVRELRQANPRLAIKINTVVNAANHDEDFAPLLSMLRPDRRKVMRVLPSLTDRLAVSDAQFAGFVDRHRAYSPILSLDDIDVMVRSYVMVDPHGRFFQNRAGERGYDYSPPILDVGADAAFGRIGFDLDRFAVRYRPVSGPGEAAKAP